MHHSFKTMEFNHVIINCKMHANYFYSFTWCSKAYIEVASGQKLRRISDLNIMIFLMGLV